MGNRAEICFNGMLAFRAWVWDVHELALRHRGMFQGVSEVDMFLLFVAFPARMCQLSEESTVEGVLQ